MMIEIPATVPFEDGVTVLEYQFMLALWGGDPDLYVMLDRWGKRKPHA